MLKTTALRTSQSWLLGSNYNYVLEKLQKPPESEVKKMDKGEDLVCISRI